MNRKKQIILILSIFLIVITFISVIIIRRRGADTERVVPRLRITPPVIEKEYEGDLNINLKVTEDQYKFPSKLPYLEIESQNTIDQTLITNIAANLNFTQEPITAKDQVKGTVHIFNNDENTLIITPFQGEIKYAPKSEARNLINNTINKQLTDDSLKAIAEKFLSEKIGIPKEKFTHIETNYLTLENTLETYIPTERSSALLFEVNFSSLFQNYPIIILKPQSYPYSVQILRDGKILNADITLPPNLKQSQDQYQIKNFEEFFNSLDQAVVISLYRGNVNLHDLTQEDLTSITIEEVSLAYLLEDIKSTIFQPVFILKGKASVKGLNSTVSAMLYLPAFSQF